MLALALFAAPAGAQAVSASPFALEPAAPVAAPAVAATAPTAGPRLDALPAAAHHAESTAPLKMMAAQRANLGQAKALMIVGAAAFVAGAIIGDTPGTIIMVGGAAVGLVGLYEYLQ
jgi:hypothetical protein